MLQFWDGKSEMLFLNQEADLALMADEFWKRMGATPFVDAD